MKRKIVVISLILVIEVFLIINLKPEEKLNTYNSKGLAFFVIQDDGTYKQEAEIPQTGYQLNTEKSTCSNGTIPKWNNNMLNLSNLSKNNTSCYLYFDKSEYKAREYILSHIDTISTRESFDAVVTTSTSKTIYKAEDDYGESYYYADLNR